MKRGRHAVTDELQGGQTCLNTEAILRCVGHRLSTEWHSNSFGKEAAPFADTQRRSCTAKPCHAVASDHLTAVSDT